MSRMECRCDLGHHKVFRVFIERRFARWWGKHQHCNVRFIG